MMNFNTAHIRFGLSCAGSGLSQVEMTATVHRGRRVAAEGAQIPIGETCRSSVHMVRVTRRGPALPKRDTAAGDQSPIAVDVVNGRTS